jgi:hypothetical protein
MENFAGNAFAVDEGPVAAPQVFDFEFVVFGARNRGMLARNFGVVQLDLIRRFATNRRHTSSNGKVLPVVFSANYEKRSHLDSIHVRSGVAD